MLKRFFRELKCFEKSRQFRFGDQKFRERFYCLFAQDYNQHHPKMPKPVFHKPREKAQRDFIDPDSRIMQEEGSAGFR